MVKPKKYLGQHFLNDINIAEKIVNCLDAENVDQVLEIGPGTGVLTKFLLKKDFNLYVIEIDDESVNFLNVNFPELKDRIINDDFLKLNLNEFFENEFALIGNFPYNISSQILFKVLEYKNNIPEVVGMFQKEVAERVSSKPGSKVYGILSVLIQAYFDVEYLFTVNESVFIPPPKVKSAVLKLKRKNDVLLKCNETLFFRVVKTAFNQRRKTLRNSLRTLIPNRELKDEILSKRPEQLSVNEFVLLTNLIEKEIHQNG